MKKDPKKYFTKNYRLLSACDLGIEQDLNLESTKGRVPGFVSGIPKVQAAGPISRFPKGQASVEFILLAVVSLILVWGLNYQLNDSFKQWFDNYLGDYVVCLVQRGELPWGLTPSGRCDSQYQAFTLVTGRPINIGNSGGATGGGSSSGGASSSSPRSRSGSPSTSGRSRVGSGGGATEGSGGSGGSSAAGRGELAEFNKSGGGDSAETASSGSNSKNDDEGFRNGNSRSSSGGSFGNTSGEGVRSIVGVQEIDKEQNQRFTSKTIKIENQNNEKAQSFEIKTETSDKTGPEIGDLKFNPLKWIKRILMLLMILGFVIFLTMQAISIRKGWNAD